MIYTINIGTFKIEETIYENRCLSASIGGIGIETDVIPWEGTKYNPWDYKYENEEFVLDAIELPPKPEPEIPDNELLLEIAADHEFRISELELFGGM